MNNTEIKALFELINFLNIISAFIFAETHLLSSTEIRTKSVLHLMEVDLKDLTLAQTDILHTMRCECGLILEKILQQFENQFIL